MFNAATQGYVCHDPNVAPVDVSLSNNASTCDGPLASTYCYESDGEFYVCSYQDANHFWHCQTLCTTNADCTWLGKTCQPYLDKTTISPSKPGYCN
jgi:hypothetical protein